MKQIRRGIGKYLRKLREEKHMTLTEVVANLSLYKIQCCRTNLSRIEENDATIRHDILAGLSLIYEITADQILFRSNNMR